MQGKQTGTCGLGEEEAYGVKRAGQGRRGGRRPGTSPPGTFWDLLGGRVVQADGKSAVVTLDIRPHHLNMIGIVHGESTHRCSIPPWVLSPYWRGRTRKW
ncbi:hypothetical protein LJK88_13095 [Paenibacillus sp. P26]|nr:hypothetical protein LJK88_13095 [Paenibacillus sp. P26]UUZ97827.1 hypothetical protein LJK87_24600 [Paenibacillus sp. P25]